MGGGGGGRFRNSSSSESAVDLKVSLNPKSGFWGLKLIYQDSVIDPPIRS